jgi:hypothetical protein
MSDVSDVQLHFEARHMQFIPVAAHESVFAAFSCSHRAVPFIVVLVPDAEIFQTVNSASPDH